MFLWPPGEQAQPEILGDVGVLVLVDQDRAEAPLVVGQHVRLRPRAASGRAAAGRRSRRRSASAAAPGRRRRARPPRPSAKSPISDAGTWSGRQPRSFQRWMMADQQPRRPAALVEVGRLDHLLDQPLLVVGVEDGEAGLAGRPARRGARSIRTPMAWKVPSHMPCDAAADQLLDPLGHLARGLVGEGDRQHLAAAGPGR